MAAFGLRPTRHLNGAVWSGATIKCVTAANDSTALYIGDPVVGTSAGGATLGTTAQFTTGAGTEYPGTILPIVTIATAGTTNRILGVVTAVEPLKTDLTKVYRVASTCQIVYIALASPDLVFEVYEDADTTPLALTNIWNTCSLIAGTGSTTTGLSGWALDSSTATTTTLQTQIVGMKQAIDNPTVGLVTSVWEVIISQPQLGMTQLASGI